MKTKLVGVDDGGMVMVVLGVVLVVVVVKAIALPTEGEGRGLLKVELASSGSDMVGAVAGAGADSSSTPPLVAPPALPVRGVLPSGCCISRCWGSSRVGSNGAACAQ